MIDVLCIGNAKVDSFLTIHDISEHCRLERASGELCIKAGEKIPIESASFQAGGNACNVAVGLSRLHLQSSLVVAIGNDDLSHTVLGVLKREKVDTSHVVIEDGSSGFSVALNFKGERTLFSQHIPRKHIFSFDSERPKWVYLTSLGKEWSPTYKHVRRFIKANTIPLAFNPGTPQLEEGLSGIKETLEVTRMFFINKEEGEKIIKGNIKSSEKEEMHRLLLALQHLGPKIVVITDGKHGAFAVDADGEFYYQGTVAAEVMERTGAGDGFATGFLAATVYNHDIQTALLWGAVNAAGVIGKVGAQPGLLTREEIEKKIRNL